MSLIHGIMSPPNIKSHMLDGKKMKSGVDYRVGKSDELAADCITISKSIQPQLSFLCKGDLGHFRLNPFKPHLSSVASGIYCGLFALTLQKCKVSSFGYSSMWLWVASVKQ